jgi:hypothetical protein
VLHGHFVKIFATEQASTSSHAGTIAHAQLQTHIRLSTVGTLKRYSKALKYEYRVKTAALSTLKRYSIFSLRPCLDCSQIPSFFTLSPSHQFLDAYMEH